MTAGEILASADRLSYDEATDRYVVDGAPVADELVLSLLGSGRLAREPWTNRYRRTEGEK